MQPPVPDGDDEVRVGDGQGAGEVDGIRARERVRGGQLTGVALDGYGELDRTRGRPVALPGLLGRVKIVITEVVVAAGGGKRGAHLGIGQPTCDGGVTSVHSSAASSLPASSTSSFTKALESK